MSSAGRLTVNLSGQGKHFDQENSHLVARDRGSGAILQGAGIASACDGFGVKFLDPIGCPIRSRDIRKNTGGRGWGETGPVRGAQEKDSHLVAGDRFARTIKKRGCAATGRDAFCIKFFDPGGRPVVGGHIGKDSRRRGRRVAASVQGSQEKDCHLIARDWVSGAIAQRIRSTTSGDAIEI